MRDTQRRWAEKYGISIERWTYIRSVGALAPYHKQRESAKARGIAWEFTPHTWLSAWEESGRWAQRGRGGFCMCRYGDVGAYSPGNVYIATASQNMKDSHSYRFGARVPKKAPAPIEAKAPVFPPLLQKPSAAPVRALTATQISVLDFIARHLKEHGFPPTRAEIAAAFGWASPNSAETHIKALQKKGRVFIRAGASRGISLAEAPRNQHPNGGER